MKTVHLWDILFGKPGRIQSSNFEMIKTEVFIFGALLALICLLNRLFICQWRSI